MARPSKYPTELRERAVRMVLESRADYPSEYEAIRSIAAKLGITSPESLRKWVRQAGVDGGARPGKTTEEIAEIKKLKKENAELRRANEMADSSSGRTTAKAARADHRGRTLLCGGEPGRLGDEWIGIWNSPRRFGAAAAMRAFDRIPFKMFERYCP